MNNSFMINNKITSAHKKFILNGQRIISQFGILKHILSHPLNISKLNAFSRWIRWHLGSRISIGKTVVVFIDESKLVLTPGMTGATMNIYCGLSEFEDMGFALHFLRQSDLFIDIGCNVGAYTVLASGAVGANTIAIDASQQACCDIMDNLYINDILSKVKIVNLAIGDVYKKVEFVRDLGPMNHINYMQDIERLSTVQMDTIDSVLHGMSPKLVKIDIEGYEYAAIIGAKSTLLNNKLRAIIMENGDAGINYGFDNNKTIECIINSGFTPVEYDPIKRELSKIEFGAYRKQNIIFVRDIEEASLLLKSSKKYRLGNGVLL